MKSARILLLAIAISSSSFIITSVSARSLHGPKPWSTTIPPTANPDPSSSEIPRLILYHQTTHTPSGRPISLLPLLHRRNHTIALTHLILAAWHIHPPPPGTHRYPCTIRLNDHPPDHPRYATLWEEVRLLQRAGVKVMAMVGGAARGSFSYDTLDAPPLPSSSPFSDREGTTGGRKGGYEEGWLFERAYAPLREAIIRFGLDGVDLDIEERMSQGGVTRLIGSLRRDFGPGWRSGKKGMKKGFVLSMAPVATALLPGEQGRHNLGGFDYSRLVKEVGSEAVDFYNAQFYNGFGSARTTRLFDRLVTTGGTVAALQRRHGQIGGIAGWEYFNGVPGGEDEPWRWAEAVSAVLRPGQSEPRLRISRVVVGRLREAWMVSAATAKGLVRAEGKGARGRWTVTLEHRDEDGDLREWLEPDVDYMALMNVDGEEDGVEYGL
ncbi:hypothetical protein VTJ49DRAFT_3527 [Mycothermus thermophilus]|uniref:GH18 domain-containing protein n=1 Tax=Humicola insolens TaxID=85995 RepID=A0ABR3V7Y8_HUMIN